MSDNGQQVPLIERLRVSDPHDSNLRRAADLCRDLGRSALAEAVSRAIDRIAELEERLASILDASEDDMPLDRAEELAALWAAGKLIGGDAHAVAITLYAALIAERGQRAAAEAV